MEEWSHTLAFVIGMDGKAGPCTALRFGPNEQTVHSSLNVPAASQLLWMTNRRPALPLNSIAGGNCVSPGDFHHLGWAVGPAGFRLTVSERTC
jgi:hypothetical protein